MMTKPSLDEMSLYTRISLVLTALAAALVMALGVLWLKQTHESIREEVEAATHVAGQWLTVSAQGLLAQPQRWDSERLLAHIQAVGRIRANSLEVIDGAGRRRYLSPQSVYKAGRTAPVWFAELVEPEFEARSIGAGQLTLILRPDPSRATLDAWDQLCAMAGWAIVLLAALFFAARAALNRALAPLGQVMSALHRTGQGRFDTRLPVFPEPELGRLAKAFNGMADRLAEAVSDNVRLESERELAERLQQSLKTERRAIARELHDELAQGITAVRALAGAIAQRTGGQPSLHEPAQSIVAVTTQMQDGVSTILHRLRPERGSGAPAAEDMLQRYLLAWQQHYPDIALVATLDAGSAPLGAALSQTLVRLVQEGLTNVARHAGASAVEVTLRRLRIGHDCWLELVVADNGCGLGGTSRSAGSGFGLAGMRERIAALAGELELHTAVGGGTRLCVRLPATNVASLEE